MSSKSTLTITIKISWWVRYLYVPMLILFARMCQYWNMDAEPNWERVEFWVRKGLTVGKPEVTKK